MTISEYITKLNARYRTGISTEHSYRSELLNLIETIVPGITITNEPKRVACGAPDYIITRRNIPIGYIEAKDIGADLYSKTYKEQFDRYRQSLDNLIITDYLTFQFYVNGSKVTTITIGEISGTRILPITDNYDQFIVLIKNFCEYVGQTIKSAQKLSKMMAAKAKLLADVIEKAIDPHTETNEVNELQNINLISQYESFKQVLIHDITPKTFSDIYAQTIAYGMFAARLNDPSLENFTRQEAAGLIPKSNPFLRKLFQYIAGYDLDDRIVWIVDALADIFRATNVDEMLRDFGKATHQTDPFIHFYETFLAEYDPKLRKSRGVWYTPEPVVNFIVRAVDDILKTEFGLAQGLADTSKIKVKVPGQGGKPVEQEVHKVQILDPAAGTGTFLAGVIKLIHQKFAGQQGIWSQYVEDHLIPRLNGFEILMASYAMAHLKLEMLLRETGYIPKRDQRLRVYLTNSLEEHHPDTGTLFANWLSTEANEANHVKRDTPVMVIVGNPPYKGESSNKGEWLKDLMADYKREPGGKEKLKERNPKWINDDYVKFLRYGQYFIEKNEEGILAFINPHGFLDNPTFRGMRWNLLKTYDKIYTIDLHGNVNKKEVTPEGEIDENVFDIEQGVSINIFIKTRKKANGILAKVYNYNLYGKRELKYKFLIENSLENIHFDEVDNRAPRYNFMKRNNEADELYNEGFSVIDLFKVVSTGVVTARDELTIKGSKDEVLKTIRDFAFLPKEEARIKFNLGKDARDWKVSLAQQDLKATHIALENIVRISYRPFDTKWTYFTGNSRGFHCMPRGKTMRNFITDSNIGLVFRRQQPESLDLYIFCSKYMIADGYIRSDNKGGESIAPLFILPATRYDDFEFNAKNTPNFNAEIINNIVEKSTLTLGHKGNFFDDIYSPINLFDYIYCVLYSSNYRSKYKDQLKTDYPRIPYPKNKNTFWQLVKLGGELRLLHLLESHVVEKFITTFPLSGSNEVNKLKYEKGKVWINDGQYFECVPQVAWEFFIGGYQPAQKWLKDRKGLELSFDDIMHYQKIIVVLTETDRIMKEIDKIDFLF